MPNPKLILVFIGKQGSGKDAASSAIQESFHETEHLAFADLLRRTCWNLFKHKVKDMDRLWGNADKKKEEIEGWPIPAETRALLKIDGEELWSGRRLLQWMGTEVCRVASGYDDIWVDMIINEIRSSTKRIFSITDCRFPNEYAALKKLRDIAHVKFIRIERDSVENTQVANHASEDHIADFACEYTLDNNGTLEQFKESVKTLVVQTCERNQIKWDTL
jgi:hypothetical protein